MAAAVVVPTLAAARAAELVEPTYTDVPYGPHERQTLNFWQAKSQQPTPLVVSIHGGGWLNGSKAKRIAADLLSDGVSHCTINYRLARTHILPAPLHDAARAIQFLRTKADAWNINPQRIVVTGKSAGAASSLWLAFHDDLADPDNADPVLRQSSRVAGAIALSGQTTLDPLLINQRIGPAAVQHPMIWKTVGAESVDELMQHWEKYRALARECSPITHVSKHDPPVFLNYAVHGGVPVVKGDGIHHAQFGVMLKEKCDREGVPCFLEITGVEKPAISREAFLKRLLGQP